MFQLERLKVAEATLDLIVAEMCDKRIETSNEIVEIANNIEALAISIRTIVETEQLTQKEATNEDS